MTDSFFSTDPIFIVGVVEVVVGVVVGGVFVWLVGTINVSFFIVVLNLIKLKFSLCLYPPELRVVLTTMHHNFNNTRKCYICIGLVLH